MTRHPWDLPSWHGKQASWAHVKAMHDLTLDTSVKLPSLVAGDERSGVLALALAGFAAGVL